MSTNVCLIVFVVTIAALGLVGLISYTNFNSMVPYDYITTGFGLIFFAVAMVALLTIKLA